MFVSSNSLSAVASPESNANGRARAEPEERIGMESAIKIGQRFEFAKRADNKLRQKAVVTRVLSNREEGIGPEADYYIADWIEARTFSEQPKALVFMLGTDGEVYLNGEWVDIMLDESPGTDQGEASGGPNQQLNGTRTEALESFLQPRPAAGA